MRARISGFKYRLAHAAKQGKHSAWFEPPNGQDARHAEVRLFGSGENVL
jgi:hypothetical protein